MLLTNEIDRIRRRIRMKYQWRRLTGMLAAMLMLTGMQVIPAFATSTSGDRITGLKIERGGDHSTNLYLDGDGTASDSLSLTAVSTGGVPDRYTWTVSNTNVIKLTASDDTATIEPWNAGTSRITVKAENDENAKTASVTVRVLRLAQTVELTDASGSPLTGGLTIYTGKATTIKAKVNEKASLKSVVWKSDDTSIATVASGKIIGKKPGTVNISVSTMGKDGGTDGALTESVAVTVINGPSSVELDYGGDSVVNKTLEFTLSGNAVLPDDEIELTAAALMDGGAPAADMDFQWQTSNKGTASIAVSGTDNETATITLGSKGTATITATDKISGKRARMKIQVKQVPEAVTVTTSKGEAGPVSVAEGKSVYMRAAVMPAAANNKRVTWTSSDPAVAAVSGTGRVTGLKHSTAPVTITATAVDGGVSGTITVNVQPVVTKVQIFDDTTQDVTNSTIEVLVTSPDITLTAAGMKNDNTAYNPDDFTWSISGTRTADFKGASDGEEVTLEIKKAGKATVTAQATDGSGKKAIVKISVLQPATSVTPLNGATHEVGVGKSIVLKAKVGPDDASKKTVTWSSASPDVEVSPKTGRVKGLAPNAAVIVTATATDGSGVSCDFTVSVKALAQTVMIRDTGSGELVNGAVLPIVYGSGDTLELDAEIDPAGATDSVTWTSSNTKIASVEPDADGHSVTIKALNTGKARIIARAKDGSSRFAAVTVQVRVPVKGLQIVPDATSVAVNKGVVLKAVTEPDNATNKKVTWHSEDETIATVGTSGRVRGVSPGETNIIATSEDTGETATCHIKVVAGAEKVLLYDDSNNLLDGSVAVALADGDLALRADIDPSDAAQDVTWTSSNKKVATVDDDGTVHLHAIGKTTIRATAKDGTNRSKSIILDVKRVVN